MIIKNFKKFLEARFADAIDKIKGDPKKIKELEKQFYSSFENIKLPKKIVLNNETELIVSWFHSKKHDFIQRIKYRTDIGSIEHLIEIIQNKFTHIFPEMVGDVIKEGDRYCIKIQENKVSFIIIYQGYSNTSGKNVYKIRFLTVIPYKEKSKKEEKTIEV